MEKKKEVLQEIHEYCKSVSTGLGEMFVGYDSWNELADDAEVVGGEIYLLRKKNGEHDYQVLGRQYEPYDRVNDFNNQCVDIFCYDKWEGCTIREVYHTCFKHLLEEAMSKEEDDIDEMVDILKDFASVKKEIRDHLTSDEYILTIDKYLNSDVVERYPMVWFEDVWEYRIALKLPTED